MDMEYGPRRAYAEADAEASIGIIDDLDRELSRLEELAGVLAERLAPISNQYEGQKVSLDVPRPEPSSALRGRVERLRDICARFDRIHRDIEL